jgi:hypothetical protein
MRYVGAGRPVARNVGLNGAWFVSSKGTLRGRPGTVRAQRRQVRPGDERVLHPDGVTDHFHGAGGPAWRRGGATLVFGAVRAGEGTARRARCATRRRRSGCRVI